MPLPVKARVGSVGRSKSTVVHAPAAIVRVGEGVPEVTAFTPTNSMGPVIPPSVPTADAELVSRRPSPSLIGFAVQTSKRSVLRKSITGFPMVADPAVVRRSHALLAPVQL